MSSKIRWGIMGTGHIANTFATAIASLDDAVGQAVGSRTQASADKFGATYGIPNCHPTYEALAADPRLPLQGFMAIPPPGADQAFKELAIVRSRWEDRLGKKLRLSMGMSGDLEAAIAAGSDQVRIGTDFFGERPGRT